MRIKPSCPTTRNHSAGASLRALTCALIVSTVPLGAQPLGEVEPGEAAPPPLLPVVPGSPQVPEIARGSEEVIETRVSYAISDGVFVDSGSDTTLAQGRRGWLEVRGRRVARIEVGQVSSHSAFLAIVPDPTLVLPSAGTIVRLLLEPLPPPPPVAEEPTTLKEDRDAAPESFEPLLGPYLVDAETKNLLHGRAGIRQYIQATSNGLEDYWRTVFDTAGTVERLGGTPWTLEWSMDAIYRGGDALSATEHYEEVYPEVRRLSLVRRFDDHSIARVGRFLSTQLPAVGTLDGIHSELVLGPYLRIGGMLGFRPDRDDLAPSGKEPTLVSYTTFYWQKEQEKTYSATGGFLFSAYEGKADRLAFLFDQHARVGRWSLFSTSEIDFDSGSALVNDGVRLTRWDLSTRYQLGATSLHAGLSRFGIPDTRAERDHFQVRTVTQAAFLEDDQWRMSLGASHRLTKSLTFEEEVSFIDSEATDDQLLWLVGLTKRDWIVRGSNLSLRFYQLGGEDLVGYGGSITGYFPLMGSRLALMPSLSARMSDLDAPDSDLEVGDIGMRLHWRFADHWSLTSGAVFTDADDIDRFRFDLGMTIRW